MINSSEFLSKKSRKKIQLKIFYKKFKTEIKFVRLATHLDDILKINNQINWLKEKDI